MGFEVVVAEVALFGGEVEVSGYGHGLILPQSWARRCSAAVSCGADLAVRTTMDYKGCAGIAVVWVSEVPRTVCDSDGDIVL